LLELDGRNLRTEPIERKELLAELLCGSQLSLVFNECFDEDGVIVYREACRLVARASSTYRSGRSPHWIKVKNPNAPAVKRKPKKIGAAHLNQRERRTWFCKEHHLLCKERLRRALICISLKRPIARLSFASRDCRTCAATSSRFSLNCLRRSAILVLSARCSRSANSL
jgi:hypothetical protein